MEEDRKDYQERLADSRSQPRWYHFSRKTKQREYLSILSLGDRRLPLILTRFSLRRILRRNVFIKSSGCYSCDLERTKRGQTSIRDFDTSCERISHILKDLGISKSGGIDAIPACLLKNIPEQLSKSLSQVLYKNKQTGIFPDVWKTGMVCAIYKKGRSWSSLLSIPSKVLERCVFIDLYLFLKPWLNNAQYNFRRGRSSVIQMLVYLNQAYNSTARDDEFEVVYTDFENAFDKVDHGILLERRR